MVNTQQKKVIYNNPVKIKSNGFTLIEVLVALAIIAISLGAILNTSGTQANQAAYLKQKTIAHWVAMNEITKLQIEQKLISTGETTGSTEMANHEWFWARMVTKTEDKNSQQVEFRVFLDKKHNNSLAHLVGYITKI